MGGLLRVRLDLARKDHLDRRVPKVFLNDNKNIGKKAKSKNELTDTYYNTDKPVHTK